MKKNKGLLAYENSEFLASREARTIRILSEYLEPEKRFKERNIQHTIVFFGSARIKPGEESTTNKYYWAAEEFAYKLATWSKEQENDRNKFYICTGGGPGIMEAANRGAHRAGEQTIGLNISLPFEQSPNAFITPELSFNFHYFYMRKLWFLYYAKALIIFPGGFGTMDELFETLTLIQTKKLEKEHIPILLYDKSFWNKLINFEIMVEEELIAPEDLELFHFFNTPDEGLEFIQSHISEIMNTVNEQLL
jgi:uncharacterized protein (TIGR00730 family)